MSAKRIEQAEVEKYWEIFSPLANGGKYLTGAQAASVLKNSQLRDDQLERVWDLADVDNDGSLDFEEFCVAMRIIFDLVNGEYPDVPPTLPDWLVPESKAHLVQATRALSGSHPSFSPLSPPTGDSDDVDDDDDDDGHIGLKDGFDWYMAPADKQKYDAIYTTHKHRHGSINFSSLTPLYDSLDVPDTDLRSAWNLVNPASEPAIGKNAALAFLHILNRRHDGFRIPRSVPPSLRATFERGEIDYNLESRRGAEEEEEAEEEEGSRAGRRRSSSGTRKIRGPTRGTDFSGVKAEGDWEEVRLKRQLADLEEKIEKVEAGAKAKKGGKRDSKPALVKRELEMLLDYKRKEIRELEQGEGRVKQGESLRGIEKEIEGVKEMVEGLERHMRTREEVLDGLRREIEMEKRNNR